MRNREREAWRWFEQARYDLAFARLALQHGFHAHACFQAQQAAEKALKALHYARGARAVLGHSVVGLLDELAQPLEDQRGHREKGLLLDQFYIPTRYPNGLPAGIPAESYTAGQAEDAVSGAADILDAIRPLLPEPPPTNERSISG